MMPLRGGFHIINAAGRTQDKRGKCLGSLLRNTGRNNHFCVFYFVYRKVN